MKTKRLLKDPYGAEIVFMFGTAKELNDFFLKRYGESELVTAGVRAKFVEWTPTDPKKYPVAYIALVKDRSTGRFDWAGCIAHECVHAVTSVFDKRGITYNGHQHDEAFAYYHEWLFRQCLREVW